MRLTLLQKKDIIKKKDREIAEFKLSGATISRAETAPYNDASFEKEMNHSCHKTVPTTLESATQKVFEGPLRSLYTEVRGKGG